MPQFPTTWGIPLCKNINKGADQVLKLCHIKAYLWALQTSITDYKQSNVLHFTSITVIKQCYFKDKGNLYLLSKTKTVAFDGKHKLPLIY